MNDKRFSNLRILWIFVGIFGMITGIYFTFFFLSIGGFLILMALPAATTVVIGTIVLDDKQERRTFTIC